MTDFTAGSNVNRCVHGGLHGDFKWPYNVPDGAFGPWSPMCKSELLDPTAPCAPYVTGQPSNVKELMFMLSEVLHAVVTLCPETPPANDPGNIDYFDPRLLAIHGFLKYNWMSCYSTLSEELKSGVVHYLFVIYKETAMRGNYVYFVNHAELADTLKAFHDNFDGRSWVLLDQRIMQLVGLVLTFGTNLPLLNLNLNTKFLDAMDTSWVSTNNTKINSAKDYSLMVADRLVKDNLTLTETLKRYSSDPAVLAFEIAVIDAGSNRFYNLRYGNGKFNVRNTKDFLTVVKSVFGA